MPCVQKQALGEQGSKISVFCRMHHGVRSELQGRGLQVSPKDPKEKLLKLQKCPHEHSLMTYNGHLLAFGCFSAKAHTDVCTHRKLKRSKTRETAKEGISLSRVNGRQSCWSGSGGVRTRQFESWRRSVDETTTQATDRVMLPVDCEKPQWRCRKAISLKASVGLIARCLLRTSYFACVNPEKQQFGVAKYEVGRLPNFFDVLKIDAAADTRHCEAEDMTNLAVQNSSSEVRPSADYKDQDMCVALNVLSDQRRLVALTRGPSERSGRGALL